ncbi:MAG: hypothetical protein HDS68_02440 [Bacteroidales bacterium]|nr:hypothetical protein [Bacteroidales bacterium]
MKPCLLVFITFMAIVALVIFIIYMCNLHARVSRLENKAAPHLEIIEREIHGIGFYVRIIVGIAIFFCVGICVHYIAVFYPRISKIKDFEHYTSSIGVDYWGVIVGFMALLVTLLVGWQIFSTIKAKDELYNTKDEIERRFTERLENLDECCKHGRSKIAELDDDINDLGESVAEIQSSILNTRAQVIRYSALTWAAVLFNESQDERLTKLIFTTISGISLFINNNESIPANAMLNSLLDNIAKLENVHLSSNQKRVLLSEANKLDGKELGRIEELKLYLTE